MRGRVWNTRWRGLALEAAGTLALVLALFGVVNLLLFTLFPSSTPLKELIRNSLAPEAPPAEKRAEATLSGLTHDVRLRRGNSIAWGGASEGMQLFSQDAVQTFDDSGATIAFGERDQLAVGSNSLVVVTRLNARDEAGPRSFRVQVEGELRGNLSASRKLQLEFAAAGHLARIKPGVGARFKVSPNDDNSASLAVYSGEVQLAGGARVPANFGVRLGEQGGVGRVFPLPPAPLLSGPQPALYRYRLRPPRVRLAWSGGAGVYHLQLARTSGFQHPVLDQRVEAPELGTDKLSSGSYFWRVSRVEHGAEGPFSSIGRCELVQLVRAPGLSVDFPPEHASVGPYTLTGRGAGGSRIFVDGAEVATEASGGFAHRGLIKPGVNLIRVEALDPAGNASYASRIVYGRL